MNIHSLLASRINKGEIEMAVNWALKSPANRRELLQLTESDDDRTSVNAMWVLSHLPKSESVWLQSLQDYFIDRLLAESHPSKKRILLQMLRGMTYSEDSIRTDFLDYCLDKINSESEPYAVRCFSIYCAHKMCRFFPELTAELMGHLEMLSLQNLSPGLRCALRTTLSAVSSKEIFK